MFKRFTPFILVALLVGCAGGVQETTERRTLTYSSGMKIAKPAPAPNPVSERAVESVVVIGDAEGTQLGTVYFDFDRYTVKPEYFSMLQDLAERLKNKPQMKVMLEGHTDEVGSVEYNLALGQRRSEAVRQTLSRFGVSQNQAEAVSYGEERLAVEGNTIEGNRKNRRAEIWTR